MSLVTKLCLVTPAFEALLRETVAQNADPKRSFEERRYQAELGNENVAYTDYWLFRRSP
jgi:hypothetical protein